MALSHPTIELYFQGNSRSFETGIHQGGKLSIPGDAFSDDEIEKALDPLSSRFNPNRDYVRHDIGKLVPGPQTVTFVGRVVNFSTYHCPSKTHRSAAGWHYLKVKDDTGVINVKLYFSKKHYNVKLGLLLTIWTPYIGNPAINANFAIKIAPYTTSIFPGRESTAHVVMHLNSDIGNICRVPLDYHKLKEHLGLMKLKEYIAGGNEIPGSMILVCVKCIGAKKPTTTKKGSAMDLLEVITFDDTAEIVFQLWGEKITSARDWKPSFTVLLLSNPVLNTDSRGRIHLDLNFSTMVDVEPEFPYAYWLRSYAVDLHKKDIINQEFPDSVWDIDDAMNGANRPLFTLGEADQCIRLNPEPTFTGFLSVTIMNLNLVKLHRRQMLMCAKCCGNAMYSNTLVSICVSCDEEVSLLLNPEIIGTLIDETGSIEVGRLLWAPQAWQDLFGRPAGELLAADSDFMSLMEQRMMFMRIHLAFGWSEDVGKLAIFAVRM